VASSDDAIVSKNLDGIITSWNQGAERIFGYTAEEAIGQSILLIIPPDRRSEEDDVIGRVRRGERVDHFETIRRRKDGTEIAVSLTISPVKDRSGRIIGASKIARDISERKQAEQAIADALAVKDEFIGLVSHELRTPVTMIVGNAALLARRGDSLDEATHAGAIEDIRHESERLNGIIENLLALARSEGADTPAEPIVLSRLVERHVREWRERSRRVIEVLIDSEGGAIAAGDEASIGHVLGNYLSNAEKYSPGSAPIEIVVERDDTRVHVRVLDRGIGIDPAEAERLFDSFYRSHNVGRTSGIGVGLSVCRRLMNAMGGECWAAARDGGGSEFGFSLPLYED
jgi:PAS domain S-box-containing protein